MKQKDFTIGKVQNRASHNRICLMLAISVGCPLSFQMRLARRGQIYRRDIANIKMRTRHISLSCFNLNIFSEASCLRDFRFRAHEIPLICNIIGWTLGVTKRSRYRCSATAATCLVVRRLARPCRWADIEAMFGMTPSAMSKVFWEVVETFQFNCGKLITQLRSDVIVNRAALYTQAVRDLDAPLDNCVSFMDCTKIKMCRPGGTGAFQRSVYSGHKRFHCLIYQSITTPDGLMMHLFAPEVWRRHDLTLYRNSRMDSLLEEHLYIDNIQYCIYGDAAYVLRPWLQIAFPRTIATPTEVEYNKKMSAARGAVEWSYKDLKQMFTFQDMKRKLKSRESPISLLYICSALLLNFKTCLGHGGQVGEYFKCEAPSLGEYTSIGEDLL